MHVCIILGEFIKIAMGSKSFILFLQINSVELPGFITAEAYSSLSRLKESYYWSPMKSAGYVGQQASSNIMNPWGGNTWRRLLPEPQKEPSESGRGAWSALEKACDNLQCEECRNDCLSFINGLHDAINIKLGKPMRTPNDFIYLRDFVSEMNRNILF
jgi:hypothetical protein